MKNTKENKQKNPYMIEYSAFDFFFWKSDKGCPFVSTSGSQAGGGGAG